MNYTGSLRDLMIDSAQYTPADDGSWARQLKMAEEEQSGEGRGPHVPLTLQGPVVGSSSGTEP